MSGYPARVARSNFGPQYVDKYPPANPEQEFASKELNLLCWQVAGVNAAAPRGMVSVDASSTAATALAQGFAWDPDQELPLLTFTRTGLGTYEFTLPSSTYADAEGNLVAVSIVGGQAIPQQLSGSNMVIGVYERISNISGRVHMYSIQGAAKVDVDFLLLLY
jgi:hypothetical protein